MPHAALNRAGGSNFRSQFEQRFSQQQSPFQGATGGLLGAFSGLSRGGGGGFDFSGFNENQFRTGRATAIDQFFNPELSGQQQDAVGAVRKNRIARGLRGRAADAASGSTRQRFLAGNQRSALDFIKQDLNRGINAIGERGLRNDAAISNLQDSRFSTQNAQQNAGGLGRNGFFGQFAQNGVQQNTRNTREQASLAQANIQGANLLSRAGDFRANSTLLDKFVGNPNAGGLDRTELQQGVSRDPFNLLAQALGFSDAAGVGLGPNTFRSEQTRTDKLRNLLGAETRKPQTLQAGGASPQAVGFGGAGRIDAATNFDTASSRFQDTVGRNATLGTIQEDIGTIQARLDGGVRSRGARALQNQNAGFARATLGQTSDPTGAARFNQQALQQQLGFLQTQEQQLQSLRTNLFSPFSF